MKAYCRSCEDSTPHRQKGLRPPVNVCDVCDTVNMPVTLIREKDGMIKHGEIAKFIEWSEGRGKALHLEPAEGLSCVLDLHGPQMWGWMTTEITEILEDTVSEELRVVKFNTLNSTYRLYFNNLNKEEKDDSGEME